MFDPNSPEFTRPITPREGAHMQVFVAHHRPFFILIGVLVAQLLLLSFQITRNHNVRLIRVWTVAVFDPFQRALGGLSTASTRAWNTYRGLWHAQQENQELRLELVAAHAEILKLTEQAAAADRLRTLLAFKNQLPLQSVAAEVIASSPGESSHAIYIDKGSDAGLTADLPVVTPTGIVGKIIVVFSHSSQVLLITDPESGVGVTLQKTRVQGVLKGGSQNLCQVHYVMNEEKVAPGEAVVTSGMDQVYPRGLPVGTVVRTGDGNIYKNILVEPAASLNRLEGVLVILGPKTAAETPPPKPAKN